MNQDDHNYYNDPRVRNAGANNAPTIDGCPACLTPGEECRCSDDDYADGKIELPWKWVVCPTCRGKGKHVNPSIDCNGLTAEDFHDDPDFMEDYFNGHYDQTCSQCEGRTTVPGIDYDAMSPKLRQAYEDELQADADYHAERMAEIRMGA
jgi:hypothetical protein